MGIFDSTTNGIDPGLMGLSAALLQAGGPSRMPISTGQAIAGGIGGGYRGQAFGTQQAIAQQELLAKQFGNQLTSQVTIPARAAYLQQAQNLLNGGQQQASSGVPLGTQPMPMGATQALQQPQTQGAPGGMPPPPVPQQPNPEITGAINPQQLNAPVAPGGAIPPPMQPSQFAPTPYPSQGGANQAALQTAQQAPQAAVTPRTAMGFDSLSRAVGGTGAPEFIKAAFSENGVATDINGNQFLMPGRANADTQQAAAKTTGDQGVRLQTEPAIAAATETAKEGPQANAAYMKALAEASAKSGAPMSTPERIAKQVDIQKGFDDSPAVKNYVEAIPNYQTMVTMLQNPNRVSTVGLLDAGAKVLNPGIGIRQNTAKFILDEMQDLPDRIRSELVDKYSTGATLSPEAMKQWTGIVAQKMSAYRDAYDQNAVHTQNILKTNIPNADPLTTLPLDPYTADALARTRGIGPYANKQGQ